MLVVVTDVGREDSFEVASIHDEDPVEAFARTVSIHRSMNAFARGARTGVRIVRMPSERNTSSNPAVNLLSRSWIKNRIGSLRSTNVAMMLRACWVAHSPVGFAVMPARCTCRVAISMNTSTYSRRNSTVSTVKEVAGDDPAGLGSQEPAPRF